MEVAQMGKYLSLKASMMVVALAGWMIGCADVVTYSRDSQREGLKLYQQGDYANAAGAFRNSARQNPRNYQSYYYLACCYDHMGQYQEAIANYKTARQTINLTLEGKEDNATRQNILTGLAGAIAKSDQRDIETNEAVQDAESKQNAESWLLLGKIYAYRGDADSAIDAFNRAALLEPNNFMVLKDYGLYLERIGQRQRAESPLRRAYTLDSNDEQVNAALRRIGVIPGPSIKDQSQLARPIVPKGPIPELHVPGMGGGAESSAGAAQSTVQAPRD
jgi:tetratricopeptide (TPR) repeat protein